MTQLDRAPIHFKGITGLEAYATLIGLAGA